jgi:RimJ/RimL family protein N-acetyltransferase
MQQDFVQLRPWNLSDLNDLVRYANNRHIAKFMTDQFPHPYLEANGREFIGLATRDKPVNIYAIDYQNKAIGSVGIHLQKDVYRNNAEIGYWLAEPFWGKGIATRAVQLAVELAFASFPINRIYASVFGNNTASKKVLEKNCFVLEASLEKVLVKNEELLDCLIYALRKENQGK